MKLGEFIKQFSHNNLIRLWYKTKEGHKIVAETFNDVAMDWGVNKQKGIFRHYIDNEILELTTCHFSQHSTRYPEAINIVIERLENQPIIEEVDNKSDIYNKAIN